MGKFPKNWFSLLVLLCVSVFPWMECRAQARPVYDRGAVGLMQMLKRLNTSASVLMIGAHPDDEDTALLAYLARGESARTAYLSLTRGDGGQNIIGTELGEALGVIRTEELLQARRLDGAEQYFTRAYDYGFSKTLDEAKAKWDQKIILCDTVRVIRNFRPLVVVAQFSGTPADGHGQHQFAGYITPLALKAANDASQCTDAGPVWQVQKFYVRHGFRATGEPRLRINTGRYDELLGRSYFEIAMEARSQHKSQEQGVLELRGDQFSGLNLVGSEAKETGIFDGLDTSVKGITTRQNAGDLERFQRLVGKALSEYNLKEPRAILPTLIEAYNVIHAMRDPAFQRKAGELREAMLLASGIQIDALSDRETVVPGESFAANVKVFVPGQRVGIANDILIEGPQGWTTTSVDMPKSNTPGFSTREVGDFSKYFDIKVPSNALPTQPYWLAEERDGDVFRWNVSESIATLPFQPAIPLARIKMQLLGSEIEFERPVEFRFADDIRGELRRNVDIVPKLTLEMDQSLMIVPSSNKAQTRQVVMTVTNHSQGAVSGTASLNFNTSVEWNYSAPSKTFELKRTGEKTAITFDVTVPARMRPGSYQIFGQAMVGEALASSTMKTIAYPHIQTHRFYRRATVDAKVIDLKTTRSKVGYIVGSGDRVPDAIRQMGFDVEIISEPHLASGDLSRFDVVVVGIRAYQVRPDVVANNQRLLDYARNGGTLIVQYQLPPYAQNYLPFPAQQGPRVADENAKVTILQPEHPVFNFPNKITDADFLGWVQERNLYNLSTMDAAYTPLLESHDAGEQENKGGLVIANVGKGNWVYCSYSFFRQLPAGVPGAYRLFANLLSLSKAR